MSEEEPASEEDGAPAEAASSGMAAPPEQAARSTPSTPGAWLLQGSRPLIAGFAAVVVIALILAITMRSGPPIEETWRAQLEQGQAKEMIAAALEIPEAERSGGQELLLGHAYSDIEEYYDAFDAYARAVEKKATDQRALDFMLEELDAKKADDVVEVFGSWPNDSATAKLIELATSGRWHERHHALRALQARGEEERVDQQAFAIRDLKSGPGCPARRRGLRMLVKAAKDRSALKAVQAARSRGWDNNCMTRELNDAEQKLSQRFR